MSWSLADFVQVLLQPPTMLLSLAAGFLLQRYLSRRRRSRDERSMLDG